MSKKAVPATKVDNPRDKATLKKLIPYWGDRLAISIPESGAVIGVGVSTIYNMIEDGRLQSVKIGRATRITTESILRLVHPAKAA